LTFEGAAGPRPRLVARNSTKAADEPRAATLTIKKGNDASRLAQARDVLLWLEYDVP
jgi:hypothetical protein